MIKAELVKEIAKSIEVEREDIAKIIDQFTQIVKTSLSAGEEVTLRGFGTFSCKMTSPRPARNISTGETIMLPERKVVKFKPSNEFREIVS